MYQGRHHVPNRHNIANNLPTIGETKYARSKGKQLPLPGVVPDQLA